jgi:hypothetical protein
MLKPVTKDYDETDYIGDLITELETLQELNFKGYDHQIATYFVNAGDAEQLNGVLQHLSNSRPKNTRVKLIAIRVS